LIFKFEILFISFAGTIRLRVVRPRDSLTIGDKCIWPVSFLKYANDQDAGVTFALRRVPPPLSIQRKSDFIQKKKQTFCETAMNEEKKISTRTTTITNSTTTNTTTTNLIYGKPPTKWWSCTVIEYDYGYSILSTQWGDVGGNSEHSKVRQYNDINEALKRSITKMKSKINKGYIKYTLNNDSFEKFKKNTSSTNSTTSTKNAEKAVDGFVLLHVGTHSEYRDTKIDNSSGRSGDGGSSSSGVDEQTCELPVWIMNELLLKENDVIEIEKVSLLSGSHVKIKLPFRLHEMDDEEFNLLQHCIHQHFIEFYDTLTEGTKIPLLWGEIFIFIEIIAVYTKSRNGQRQQLDAVNIRRSEVVNNLTYDFVPNDYDVKTEQGKKEEIQKETKDNEYDELGNDTETQELVKIFGLTPDQGVTLTSDNSNNEIKEDNDLTLIDGITSGLNKLKHYAEQIKFSPGSNSFRFMVRVKDYLEQSDPDMNWLLTFEQILKGEVDMFNYIDEYESARWIDPLSRIDEDEIPMMMRFSSAQDDQKGIAYSLLPNGNKIKVNKENQVRYLDLWLRHKLESEIDESTRWFVEGLKNVIPLGLLNIFNPNELQILLSGQPFLNDDNSTILNTFLNDHIVYQMDNNAPIIQYFKEAIRRFTPNERSMVFRFWTGMTSLPPGGLDCLHPKCTIELSTSSTEMLPLATTCYNLLVIPEYNSVEVLMEKLRKGCEYGMRFGRY
jgi:predicted DNA-binding WGR domain protein